MHIILGTVRKWSSATNGDGDLPGFKANIEALVSEESTKVPLAELSDTVSTSDEDEDC